MLRWIRDILIALLLFELVLIAGFFILKPFGISIPDLIASKLFEKENHLFTLVEKIEEMKILELATMKMNFVDENHEIFHVNKIKFLGPIGTRTVRFQTNGYVKAGYDLEKLPANFIRLYSSKEGNRVIVALPGPTVLDVNVEVDRSKILTVDRSLFASLDGEREFLQALQDIKKSQRQRAEKRGILDKTRAETRKLLKEMITGLGGFNEGEIAIAFEDELDKTGMQGIKRPGN